MYDTLDHPFHIKTPVGLTKTSWNPYLTLKMTFLTFFPTLVCKCTERNSHDN